jgi:hypothetical protein
MEKLRELIRHLGNPPPGGYTAKIGDFVRSGDEYWLPVVLGWEGVFYPMIKGSGLAVVNFAVPWTDSVIALRAAERMARDVVAPYRAE